MNLIADPPIFELDMELFADIAYTFMTGIPSSGSAGFCMMDPGTLKKQRWTYVKHWLDRLMADKRAVVAALTKK